MKAFVITIVILILFLIGAVFINQYIDHSAGKIKIQIQKLESSIAQKNWEKVGNDIKILVEEWETTKKFWLTFLEHKDLDNIDISLAKIETYIKLQEKTDSMVEIAKLKILIDHIVEKDALKIINIL